MTGHLFAPISVWRTLLTCEKWRFNFRVCMAGIDRVDNMDTCEDFQYESSKATHTWDVDVDKNQVMYEIGDFRGLLTKPSLTFVCHMTPNDFCFYVAIWPMIYIYCSTLHYTHKIVRSREVVSNTDHSNQCLLVSKMKCIVQRACSPL